MTGGVNRSVRRHASSALGVRKEATQDAAQEAVLARDGHVVAPVPDVADRLVRQLDVDHHVRRVDLAVVALRPPLRVVEGPRSHA